MKVVNFLKISDFFLLFKRNNTEEIPLDNKTIIEIIYLKISIQNNNFCILVLPFNTGNTIFIYCFCSIYTLSYPAVYYLVEIKKID